MPYANGERHERAHPLGHVPTIQNELVARRMARYRIPSRQNGTNEHKQRVSQLLHHADTLPGADRGIQWLMAVDGSHQEEEVDPRFPSTRLMFSQVAAVLIDLHKLKQRRHGFPAPAAIADAQHHGVFATFLPSSNLGNDDEVDPVAA